MSEQASILQEFWWEIEKWDNEIIPVKPQNAALVQAKMDKAEGFIKTMTRSINVKDIKDFRQTAHPYSEQKALGASAEWAEEAARQLEQPKIVKHKANGIIYEAVEAKWVKKLIPRREWIKLYQNIPSYKLLNDKDSYIEMAFRIPTHQVSDRVQLVLGQELAALEAMYSNQH